MEKKNLNFFDFFNTYVHLTNHFIDLVENLRKKRKNNLSLGIFFLPMPTSVKMY